MLSLITINCPSCGSRLKLDESITQASCDYCGSYVIIDDIFGVSLNNQQRKDLINKCYEVLKDNLEDDDDFQKTHELIEQMSSIDPNEAFKMWYSLLHMYEDYISNCRVNATYYFIDKNLDTLSETLGAKELDNRILTNEDLYNILFCRYCYAADHYNYTQKLMQRLMTDKKFDVVDKMFKDAYNNHYKTHSWFETIDGFLFDIQHSDFSPSKNAMYLIVKWAGKISDKKEKAKIMISLLATGMNFDISLLK